MLYEVITIRLFLEIARISSSMGKYAQSYDNYWEALIYANKINDSIYVPPIYTGLGVLYSLFGMDNQAEEYLYKSINFLKKRGISTNAEISTFRTTYYVLASHNRENRDNSIAQKYLDTCQVIYKKS